MKVTHCTVSVTLLLSGNNSELIQLCLISTLQSPLVLGFPWLKHHNPQINWANNKVYTWSPFWLSHCLQFAPFPERVSPAPKAAVPPHLSMVPQEHHDFREGFSKELGVLLSPHCPYYCPINLLAGATLPTSRLHNLSCPER